MKRRCKDSCWIDALSSDNKLVSSHRRNLPHIQRDYRPHFITFCTKERSVLPDWARRIVLDCCIYGHDMTYNLYIAVVMPDHVHMILTPMEDRGRMMISSLSAIMKGIKGTAAHAINHRLNRRGPVWLEESFDHVVRSDENLDAKIAYILANPVRKGLVNLPAEYPWLWTRPKPEP
jgi:REP element-mobilizing transposase RayT